MMVKEGDLAKPKTYFEQIPLAVAQAALQSKEPLICGICGVPVVLESCKIDEKGTAVHERCYFEKVSRRNPSRK